MNYQCAWSFDVLGKEKEAVPYYLKAISGELKPKDLEGAYIGLGSTYRTIGDYEASKEIFIQAMAEYPNNYAIKAFFAMTLYNLNEHSQAIEILLDIIGKTSSDASIQDYKQALLFYANQLDTVWE